jgi:Spy/CpxP family protein refolding chaperone
MMSRFRLLPIGLMLMAALTAPAQQTATGSASTDEHSQQSAQGVPTVEQHLKVLSEKLDLTSDQQAKAKPILQELHDGSMKLAQDESLTREERLDKVRPLREKADQQLREILTDDQKKKLDQLEQGPHPELHGSLHG